MRSRAARLSIGAAAWIALGAAAFFIIRSEKQIAETRAAVRAFDLHARAAADRLGELRASQQAYVAAGQGTAFWMPKVARMIDAIAETVATLRQSTTGEGARAALDKAASHVAEFGSVDQRARDYIKAGELLMAADIVFTEGGEAAAGAAREVEHARLEAHQALDAWEGARRKQEALAAAAAAGLVALAIALLVPTPRATASDSNAATVAPAPPLPGSDDRVIRGDHPLQAAPVVFTAIGGSDRATAPALRVAAQLCTDLGRVSDLDELTALLGRAAEVLDASGLIVWAGNATGADLRPALAHGYSPKTVAGMPSVPRSSDNAAAAAYRSGALQIVLARPGSSTGAIVAPLLSAEGCIGALSAEIRGGAETSDTVQALAAIVAAQLAGVLVTTPEGAEGKTAKKA